MPPEYNYNRFTGQTNIVRIRHFAGDEAKFWRNQSETVEYRKMSWDQVLTLHEKQVKKRG